jgi:hypothetical protein
MRPKPRASHLPQGRERGHDGDDETALSASVPEPATALLLSAGIVGLAVRRHGARGASLE